MCPKQSSRSLLDGALGVGHGSGMQEAWGPGWHGAMSTVRKGPSLEAPPAVAFAIRQQKKGGACPNASKDKQNARPEGLSQTYDRHYHNYGNWRESQADRPLPPSVRVTQF